MACNGSNGLLTFDEGDLIQFLRVLSPLAASSEFERGLSGDRTTVKHRNGQTFRPHYHFATASHDISAVRQSLFACWLSPYHISLKRTTCRLFTSLTLDRLVKELRHRMWN